MNLFEVMVLDTVLILFPLIVYNLFLVSNKNINNKTKSLIFSFLILSSIYLVYRYSNNSIINLLVLNSLVLIGYLKNHYYLANIIGITILLLYYTEYNHLVFLIIPYIILIFIYKLKLKIKLSDFLFIDLFLLVNYFFFLLWIKLFNIEIVLNFKIIQLFSIMVLNYIIIHIIYYLYDEGEKIINHHTHYQELQQEKKLRLSLFKITHEIKNPIAVIKAYLDMLNVNNQKQVSKYIPIIKGEIDRLLVLLQDFMLVNKDNIDKDIMDINMLIEEVIKSLNPLLKEKQIEIKTDIIDDEILIDGDYKRLSQVLINVLKNSVEAMDKEKGIIKIKERINNNSINIAVEDNGSGISESNLKQIKTPFYTTKQKGTGLGVSLSSEIIKAHKGRMNYQSKEGVGTNVLIELPLDRKDDIFEKPVELYN